MRMTVEPSVRGADASAHLCERRRVCVCEVSELEKDSKHVCMRGSVTECETAA